MSAHRWPCSVPGCRCTVGRDQPFTYGSWALCRKHWPLVPIKWRKALRRADTRRYATEYGSAAERRAKAAYRRLTDRVLRYAIERALGLA
jgi:hypothetical protein